jgi:hypothetical protein
MAEAVSSGAVDIVGIARALAIEPDLPKRVLQGHDPHHVVKPITTGIAAIDRMALMEVAWYSRQLRRMANGGEPRPGESGFIAFLAAIAGSGWHTFKTRRLRA